MKFNSDVDIDLADRSILLEYISHTTASIRDADTVRKHNTGIYVTDIPWDPINRSAAIDYRLAEQRGYIKLDLLNVFVYKHVRDEQHLNELMKEPDWSRLTDRTYFGKLIHIGNHYDVMNSMPEPIDSIIKMAMFLSVIRPGKKHLIGQKWADVERQVWTISDDGYFFKRSHAIAYSHLVVVHMNLLSTESFLQE